MHGPVKYEDTYCSMLEIRFFIFFVSGKELGFFCDIDVKALYIVSVTVFVLPHVLVINCYLHIWLPMLVNEVLI